MSDSRAPESIGHSPVIEAVSRGSIAVLGYFVVSLCALAAIGFLVAALHSYVHALFDPAIAAVLIAAGLVVLASIALLAVRLVRQSALTNIRSGDREPAGETELLAAVSRVAQELGGKTSPLVTVGLTAAAGFLYGARK